MGTIKHNDLRTSLRAKELIQNARSNDDLGSKTKEQEEEWEREEDGQLRERRSHQKLVSTL